MNMTVSTTQQSRKRSVAQGFGCAPEKKSVKVYIEARLKKEKARKIVEVILSEVKQSGCASFIKDFEAISKKIDTDKLEREHCIKVRYCDADINPRLLVVEFDLKEIIQKIQDEIWDRMAEKHLKDAKHKKKTGVKYVQSW